MKKIELALNEYSLYDEFLEVGKVISVGGLIGLKRSYIAIKNLFDRLLSLLFFNKKVSQSSS